jgi:hypothetical protein
MPLFAEPQLGPAEFLTRGCDEKKKNSQIRSPIISTEQWVFLVEGRAASKTDLLCMIYPDCTLGLEGPRASILATMRSASEMASAIAASSMGEGRPSQFASLRTAKSKWLGARNFPRKQWKLY